MILTSMLLLVAEPAAPAPFAPIAGEWVVDLSVSPDEPYVQPMIVAIAPDKAVTGEFYNSTIESGRAGQNQGRMCISFQTSDGMGPYYHAACLMDGKMVGQSWAEHRAFVLPWTATRGEPKP